MQSLFLKLETYFPKTERLIKRQDLEEIYGSDVVQNALKTGLIRQGHTCGTPQTYCWLTSIGKHQAKMS